MKFSRFLFRPVHKIISRARDLSAFLHDTLHGSYGESGVPRDQPLFAYFAPVPAAALAAHAEQILALSNHYLAHRFDLLGSGWTRVHYGMKCRGLEGRHYPARISVSADKEGRWLAAFVNAANARQSKALWRLIDGDYAPIDWHIDFKSWRAATWHGWIPYGHRRGVDVKVPWELARMQHLPQLAFAYTLAQSGDTRFKEAAAYVREFRNQILDFTAANPPRFGVNWRCAMDVAIRRIHGRVQAKRLRTRPLHRAISGVERRLPQQSLSG
jgi:hypothetical protein